MSAIFISYCRADRERSAELKEWLERQGYRSVFLDVDEESGIAAGKDWEQELYRQLRLARAVIVLCSEHWVESRWSFAEVVHARALGKQIFPVIVSPVAVDPMLSDRQVVDLTVDREGGLARLARGLSEMEAEGPLNWDTTRPPYPGLMAFQQEDAGVFFGRDSETGACLDLLGQMKRYGGARLMLVLGASGSGKSSLVRAGVVPRLARSRDEWLVVGPWQPGGNPAASLASALAQSFQREGEVRDWRQIRDRLDGPGLAEFVEELPPGSGRREAAVVMVIDQFEELLGHPADHPANLLLAALREALDRSSSLLVVAVMRSDFLERFQSSAAISGVEWRKLAVEPIKLERLAEVIEKPATLAGFEFEPGLVQSMLSDARTEDALPLLAFTLREMYDQLGRERLIRMTHYRDRLGGLQGSIERSADALLAAVTLTKESENALRDAFLLMVRVNEEGQFARRGVVWDKLPEAAWPVLEKFVRARLLVSWGSGEGRTLEVAHEALFRVWGKLAGWLNENREALRLSQEVAQAAQLWQQNAQSPEYLWSGGRLARAMELREALRLRVDKDAGEFLDTARETQQRAVERRSRQRLGVMLAAVALAAAMAVLAIRQGNAARTAVARQLVYLSESVRQDRPMLAALLAREAVKNRPTSRETNEALREAVARLRPSIELKGHTRAVVDAAWSPSGQRIATISNDGTARIWTVEGRPVATLAGHSGESRHLSWSADGQKLLTVSDTVVIVWSAAGDKLVTLGGHASPVRYAAWNANGERILTVSDDGKGRVFAANGGLLVSLDGHKGPVVHGTWNRDGTRILTSSADHTARLWDAGGRALAVLEGHSGAVSRATWSPDGNRILTASEDGTARLWDGRGSAIAVLPNHGARLACGEWSPDGERVLTASEGSGAGYFVPGFSGSSRVYEQVTGNHARLWDRDGRPAGEADGLTGRIGSCAWRPDGQEFVLLSRESKESSVAEARVRFYNPQGKLSASLDSLTEAPLGWNDAVKGYEAAWSPDGKRIVTTSSIPHARVWNLEPLMAASLAGHFPPLDHGAWSPDGQKVATVSFGTGRVLDLAGALLATFESPKGVEHLAWSPDGTRLVSGGFGGVAHIWDWRGRVLESLVGHSSRITHVAWNPKGDRILTTSADGTARVWQGDHAIAVLEGHRKEVKFGVWSPDGERIVTIGQFEDEGVRLWTGAGRLIGVLKHHGWGSHAAWSPDGALLATADDNLRLWDRDGRSLGVFGAYTNQGMIVWSPDGERMVTTAFDQPARIIDRRGRKLAELRMPGSWMKAAWSPDSRRVITASDGGTAGVWDLEGRLLFRLRHPGRVHEAAWSPDGRRILTISDDPIARIWPSVELLDYANSVISRDFTKEERTIYGLK